MTKLITITFLVGRFWGRSLSLRRLQRTKRSTVARKILLSSCPGRRSQMAVFLTVNEFEGGRR
jgi:hypothetical protein